MTKNKIKLNGSIKSNGSHKDGLRAECAQQTYHTLKWDLSLYSFLRFENFFFWPSIRRFYPLCNLFNIKWKGFFQCHWICVYFFPKRWIISPIFHFDSIGIDDDDAIWFLWSSNFASIIRLLMHVNAVFEGE